MTACCCPVTGWVLLLMFSRPQQDPTRSHDPCPCRQSPGQQGQPQAEDTRLPLSPRSLGPGLSTPRTQKRPWSVLSCNRGQRKPPRPPVHCTSLHLSFLLSRRVLSSPTVLSGQSVTTDTGHLMSPGDGSRCHHEDPVRAPLSGGGRGVPGNARAPAPYS